MEPIVIELTPDQIVDLVVTRMMQTGKIPTKRFKARLEGSIESGVKITLHDFEDVKEAEQNTQDYKTGKLR